MGVVRTSERCRKSHSLSLSREILLARIRNQCRGYFCCIFNVTWFFSFQKSLFNIGFRIRASRISLVWSQTLLCATVSQVEAVCNSRWTLTDSCSVTYNIICLGYWMVQYEMVNTQDSEWVLQSNLLFKCVNLTTVRKSMITQKNSRFVQPNIGSKSVQFYITYLFLLL